VVKVVLEDQVQEGALRLLEHAHRIKQEVDLTGTRIALDDCYEVGWE